jgi:hypothetical protein
VRRVITDSSATLRPADAGLQRLELEGLFSHPHWLAFFCGGLSAAGVAVVSGRAVRTAPMRWEGYFLVEGSVEGLDPLALASARPEVRDPAAPRLSSYTLRRRADRQLELQLEAPDALGFLGRLLSRVSLLGLLPSELDIATVGGQIKDTIVLGSIGSGEPPEDLLVALEKMLSRLLTA